MEGMAPKKAVRAGVPADIKVVPDGEEILTEDAAGAAGHMTEEESEDEVLELKQMFQWFMQDQQERDARQAQEAVRQETR